MPGAGEGTAGRSIFEGFLLKPSNMLEYLYCMGKELGVREYLAFQLSIRSPP